jgi:RHS repeat-associated protein
LGELEGATFTGNRTITFVYDATGKKLMQRIATNAVTDNTATRQYILPSSGGAGGGCIEYNGANAMHHIATAEGRFLPSSGGAGGGYEYSLKDHLGNTRLTITDTNADGMVSAAEVTQSNMYYAFGLEFAAGAAVGTENKYKYNGKELMTDFGLGLYDYGARMYDAATGRWNGVDALSEKYTEMTNYCYAANNPINIIDPNGMDLYLLYYTTGNKHNGKEDKDADRMFLQAAITRALAIVNSKEYNEKEDHIEIRGISDLLKTWEKSVLGLRFDILSFNIC